MEKLKDKAAAAAQAILEPGIATDDGQQMNREQFGVFIRRFAAASGLSFSAITDFLLVVPVFDYDPAFTDPGECACTFLPDAEQGSAVFSRRHLLPCSCAFNVLVVLMNSKESASRLRGEPLGRD